MTEERGVLTMNEVQEVLGIGKNLCYDMLRAGTIPSIRLGRKIIIPKHSFYEWLNSGTKN